MDETASSGRADISSAAMDTSSAGETRTVSPSAQVLFTNYHAVSNLNNISHQGKKRN